MWKNSIWKILRNWKFLTLQMHTGPDVLKRYARYLYTDLILYQIKEIRLNINLAFLLQNSANGVSWSIHSY